MSPRDNCWELLPVAMWQGESNAKLNFLPKIQNLGLDIPYFEEI